jgi:hypothetical protein
MTLEDFPRCVGLAHKIGQALGQEHVAPSGKAASRESQDSCPAPEASVSRKKTLPLGPN